MSLIYSLCVRTKKGLAQVYATSYTKAVIYKNVSDGRMCTCTETPSHVYEHLWDGKLATQMVKWFTLISIWLNVKR